MPAIFQDLSQALRALSKRPGFTLAALVTLTLGIGANVTVFSLVNALLLRPLPFGERTDRVVTLHSTQPHQPDDWEDAGLSYPDLADLQREANTFDGVAGFLFRNFTVSTDTDAERLQGQSVTSNLFPLLGIEPILGRNFLPEEAAAPGLETSVILTHGLWQRRFGGDPSIIGRGVVINDRVRTVVGVMPPGFKFPHRSELYMPFRWDEQLRSSRSVAAIGILKSGVSMEQAQSDVAAIAARLEARYPDSNRGYGLRVLRFREAYLGRGARAVSITLMAAVAFVLLIVCANLTNLLLVRGASRQREMAVRAAMGASKWRLGWAVLSESTVLTLLGCVGGGFAAVWMLDYLGGVTPEELPYWFRADVDTRIVIFTIGLTALTTIAIGILPALRATRPDVVSDLKEGARGVSLGCSAQRLQAVLAASQVALCLALLVGANLMIRSFLSLQRADLGFDDSPMLTLRAYLAGDRFDESRARAVFFSQAVDVVKAVPSVKAVVATSSIPGDDGGSPARLVIDGRTEVRDEVPVQLVTSTSDLFDTLGLRLVDGRSFTSAESIDPESRVAVLNERLARRLWPDSSAIGRRVGIPGRETIEWVRVIGVAPNVHYEEAGEETEQSQLNVYLPFAFTSPRMTAILVRAEGDPQALATPVRAALRQLHSGLALFDIRTMREVRRFTSWEQRFFGFMMGSFAASALLLACLGVYALLAYAARRRTHEIGVRLALGADRNAVVSLFAWQASRIGLVGLGAGLLLSVLLAQALRGVVTTVDVLDPWLFAQMAGALLVVVAAASYLPARRAARTEPMAALRAE
jgi:putative ABC transport system permease protein